MSEQMTIEEYTNECVAKNGQALAKRLASLKAQAKKLGHDWLNTISQSVPYDVRTYSDDRMTHAHLDYIEKYLALPLCFRCHHLHTSKQCPRCHKPLCGYCEWGTNDIQVNACPECALALRKEQEAGMQMCEHCHGQPAHGSEPRSVLLAQDEAHPTMYERTPHLWLCEHCQWVLIGAFQQCSCQYCQQEAA